MSRPEATKKARMTRLLDVASAIGLAIVTVFAVADGNAGASAVGGFATALAVVLVTERWRDA